MENENKPIFIDGMSYNERSTQQPEWILGKLSVNLNKFVPFLKANVDERGWLNIDIKRSKKGEVYLALNTWKPTARTAEENADKAFEKIAGEPEYLEHSLKEEHRTTPSEDYPNGINLDDIPF